MTSDKSYAKDGSRILENSTIFAKRKLSVVVGFMQETAFQGAIVLDKIIRFGDDQPKKPPSSFNSRYAALIKEFERSGCQPIKSPNLAEKFRLQGSSCPSNAAKLRVNRGNQWSGTYYGSQISEGYGQGPPLKMHLKLSPRLPRRGDILIDINDRSLGISCQIYFQRKD
ncbi:hypothetical protein IFM89_026683 [Coptis chinensis]|uniref:Uncharacterized protein n=1 Tax=Coptis chinensis TaxID=261450 RepID=A0A835GZZ9_9MAGN|nr:hypothetical protein IFM89_026683 [Coptis chinensis]